MVSVARKAGGKNRAAESGPKRGGRGKREARRKRLAPYVVSERAKRTPRLMGKSGMCSTMKLRYSSERAAGIALENARRVRREKGSNHIEVRYYECPDCRGYHLTSQPLDDDPTGNEKRIT